MDGGQQLNINFTKQPMGALFHEDITSPTQKHRKPILEQPVKQVGCHAGGSNNNSHNSHWNRVSEQMSKRKQATEWIYEMLGVKIPFATDRSFRGALYDGTVLCRLINAVRPNTIPKIIEPSEMSNSTAELINTMDNLSNFIQAAEWLGVPVHEIFSISDIEADGLEERARVVSSVLQLKQIYQSGRSQGIQTRNTNHETASVNFTGPKNTNSNSNSYGKRSFDYSSRSSSPARSDNSSGNQQRQFGQRPHSGNSANSSAYYSNQSSRQHSPINTRKQTDRNARKRYSDFNNNNHNSYNSYNSDMYQENNRQGNVMNNNNNNNAYSKHSHPNASQSSPQKQYQQYANNLQYANVQQPGQQHGYYQDTNHKLQNQSQYPMEGNFTTNQLNKLGGFNNNVEINQSANEDGSQQIGTSTAQQQTQEALNRIMRNCSEITQGLQTRTTQQQMQKPHQQQQVQDSLNAQYQVNNNNTNYGVHSQAQSYPQSQVQSVTQSNNISGLLGNLNLNQMGVNIIGGEGSALQQGDGESTQLSTISEALKPVVESVVTGLIKEYEKRMMHMDADLKAMRERTNMWQARCQEMQAELKETKALIDSRPAFPENSLTDEERQELERLKDAEQALLDKLAEAEMENQQMEQELLESRANTQELEFIATNYKTIQEENKQLYNMVQDLKGSIRVYCRIRPMGATGDQSPSCLELAGERDIAIYSPAGNTRKAYQFDQIFAPEITQEEIYAETQGLIRCVLDGFNVCIFAYGQTGSGKTYTMSGPPGHDNKGIAFRALQDLFFLNEERSAEFAYTFEVQMLEIYNEIVRDLLVEPDVSQSQRLELRSTERSGMNVPGAAKIPVGCTEDVFRIMEMGGKCRATGETKMNERSSRSHCILTVIVDGQSHIAGDRTHGCLHLVDLAGSERVARSEATGERLEEAKHINKSLSALGDVMSSLAAKKSHIPFRNSKLTQLLQDSLSGNAKALTILHIAPEETSYGESSTTLQFGARVTSITLGQVQKNSESGQLLEAKDTLKHQQKEIEQLRQIITDEKRQAENEKLQLQSEIEDLRRGMSRVNSLMRTTTAPSALNVSKQTPSSLTVSKHGSFSGNEKGRSGGVLLTPRSRGSSSPRARENSTFSQQQTAPRLPLSTKKSSGSSSQPQLRHSATSLRQSFEAATRGSRDKRWK